MDITDEKYLKPVIIILYGLLATIFALGLRFFTLSFQVTDAVFAVQASNLASILLLSGSAFLFLIILTGSIFVINQWNDFELTAVTNT